LLWSLFYAVSNLNTAAVPTYGVGTKVVPFAAQFLNFAGL